MMGDDDAAKQTRRRQWLSALLDGEGEHVDQACNAWREDASVRADWHAYHLIGELLRSDDVRCAPQRDAGFLTRLRERLAAEPVVLAPTAPLARPMKKRGAWAARWAVAAGFIVMAGVVVLMRVTAPVGTTQESSAALASSQAVAGATDSTWAGAAVDDTLIRSAELDRYLAAHKQYSGISALAAPGGGLRSVVTEVPGR
jgi:sigma-E factor negative regulatory protein RseA